MVNYEVKGILAKLLATENLVVEHQNVDTASFNVDSRVLTLPMWEKAGNDAYDLLVAHEVGHALFTPDDRWEQDHPDLDKAFVNVTEDARIEKLIKRKFAGLPKTFFRGYKELNDIDLFELEDVDISEMNFADRVNLFYKLGNHIDVPFFNKREEEILKVIGESETFEEAIQSAILLRDYCDKEGKMEQQKVADMPNTGTGGGSGEASDSPQDNFNPQSSQSDDGKKEEEEDKEWPTDFDPLTLPPKFPESDLDTPSYVKTDEAFSNGMKNLNEKGTNPNIYVEIPRIKMEHVIVSNEEIHKNLDYFYSNPDTDPDAFKGSDLSYLDFKKSAQSEVNFMVKEFEMKKSADAYARVRSSKTGVIDTNKLHSYKFNDDIFRKINVVPDGKNHGLVFILDWSGSMHSCIDATIKQLFNLVWFCNKVNIPFDVYAFTNSHNRFVDYQNFPPVEMKEGMMHIDESFSLLNFLSSRMSKKQVEKQMKSIWRLVYKINHHTRYHTPIQYTLSGTPLFETMMCLHEIIPTFKKNNNLQKVQCVILTDGEGHNPSYVTRRWNDYTQEWVTNSRYFDNYHSGKTFLRNRKTGHTYTLIGDNWDFTKAMLEDLKQSFPDTNFIGIRLTEKRDMGRIIRAHHGHVDEEVIKKVRKDKFHETLNAGYTKSFIMITENLHTSTSFDVNEDATKTQIKNAFIKSLKAKSLNKKVLSSFMDLVC